MSSDHGRRCENPWRIEEDAREMKARKAGVAMGGWVWVVVLDCWFEIGSVGGEAIGVARDFLMSSQVREIGRAHV